MRTAVSRTAISNLLPVLARQLASLSFQPAQSAIPATRHSMQHLRRPRRHSFARLTRSVNSSRLNTAPISTAVYAMPARHTCAELISRTRLRKTTSSLPMAYVKVTSVIPSSATRRSPGSTLAHSATCRPAALRHTLISCARAPEETGEGYASRAELFDHVLAAATKVISQRQNNPFNAAVDIGAYKPIASNNPHDITAEVANRFSSQESLRALGINAPILSSEEAAALSEQVRGTKDVNQTISLLQSMGETLPAPAMRQVASAIAPNNAATAYSALLLGTPDNQYDNTKPSIAYSQFIGYKPTMNKYDVSKVILAGDQLLNPTKAMKDAGITPVQLPSEDKLKRAFDDQVGNSFANNPQARQLSYNLFKAAYAGIAYQSGDASMTRTDAANSDVVEKAAQYATGGVYKGFNGGDVVMPFGMDKSTFKDRYTASAQQALKNAGLNVNAASNFTPVNIGNNQYRLVSGSGRWATDPKTNEAIVVRVE
ncbi:hypothetical protein [Salmonella phage VB_ST_E15]|nr:hypothetical protein [Salmonella phage VB_ST_E15]